MLDFRWKTYEITSPKIKRESGRVRLCFLSDLHGFSFGKGNCELLEAICKREPDAILVGGDMIIGKPPIEDRVPKELLLSLAGRYPVWYAWGNHEYRVAHWPEAEVDTGISSYEESLKEAGIVFLHNTRGEMEIRGTLFHLYGLELEYRYFRKPRVPDLRLSHMQRLLHCTHPRKEAYNILLAHNPRFGDTYFQWGSDLILSGHYHGGIVRLNEHHGMAAPQDLFFPRYCCGDFRKMGRTMVVSAGLGEHTLPLRIHNPREVIELVLTTGK